MKKIIHATLGIFLASSFTVLPITALQPNSEFSVGRVFAEPANVASKKTPTTKPGFKKTRGAKTLKIDMKALGNETGFRLKTVKTQRDYEFTRPRGWKILPSSRLVVKFQHGASLLPERSSLNVLVNNRILKSVALDKDTVKSSTFSVAIPPELLKDKNTLSFQVDQHYTYKCEDPYSEELWTDILPGTEMTLNYQPMPTQPNLASYPYPLIDNLNHYFPTEIAYVVPQGLSSSSLEGFGVIATHMGQHSQWHPLNPEIRNTLPDNQNAIVIGTPAENNVIQSLSNKFSLKLSGTAFRDKSGITLPDDFGVIQMIQNPKSPSHVVLVITGNSPEGVKKAAHLLVQNQLNKVMVGQSAIVEAYTPGDNYPYRAWDNFILRSGDRFYDLDLKTQTSRGITALPIFYTLKLMPDILLKDRSTVKIKTRYSYASQLDVEQSKLEVLLNGNAIKSIPLDDKQGKTLAEAEIEIPTEAFSTYNQLEYRFHIYPEKYDMCRFVTDVHLWGTIHNTSSIDYPGEVKTPLPNLGLMNDGGYPFTAYQDLSKTSVVLPDNYTATDLNAMLQLLTRFGRESRSLKGIELTAYKASELPEDHKTGNNLIVIGATGQNTLLEDLNDKSVLLTAPNSEQTQLKTADQEKLAELQYQPGQGVIEELLSPWNENRVVLLLTGVNAPAIQQTAALFERDAWFKEIQEGNLMVVNANGPKSTIIMKKGEARFFYEQDQRDGFKMPIWGWITLGFFAFLGVLSILRFLLGW
ncbi:MAG: cellulose biosynthesis cyclic di-GMP-binding regulatory protein BcsB [Cyanobacteria bacterium P01_H01_bin.74]